MMMKRHVVDGIVCREIPMDLPKVGTVTILEATSESQEDLVNMALMLEDENDTDDDSTQKLNAGDPYGAVLWPAAWAVARHILESTTSKKQQQGSSSKDDNSNGDNDDPPLKGLTILELGTGTGLVSLAAALGGADKVIASDYEEVALSLTRYAADTFLPSFLDDRIETKIVDMCDQTMPLPPADIVVAADVMYEPRTGIALAHRVKEAIDRGSRVVVGDSPGRAGRPNFLKTLIEELGMSADQAKFVDTVGKTCTGPRHDLICGKDSKSVSETPEELAVAIMDLDPEDFPNDLC